MMQGRRDIDPDAFIRQRVFQRIVDRLELDPRRASRSIIRTSGVGYVGGVAVLGWYAVRMMADIGEPFWSAPVALLMLLAPLALQVWQVHSPPFASMSPIAGAQRMIWILAAFMLAVILALLPPQTPFPVRAGVLAVLTGLAGGISAVYVHQCRKPPRRPRKEPVPQRTLVKA